MKVRIAEVAMHVLTSVIFASDHTDAACWQYPSPTEYMWTLPLLQTLACRVWLCYTHSDNHCVQIIEVWLSDFLLYIFSTSPLFVITGACYFPYTSGSCEMMFPISYMVYNVNYCISLIRCHG